MAQKGNDFENTDGVSACSSDKLKKSVGRLRAIASISFTTAFIAVIIALLELFLILKLAHPSTIQTISYLNDEGVLVTENAISSVPTISQSSSFLQSCLKKTFQVTSGSYDDDIKQASYCYDSRTEPFLRKRIGEIVDSYFSSRKIVGGFTVDRIGVSYVNSYKSVGHDIGFCTKDIFKAIPEANDCRSYDFTVYLDAINYQTGKTAPIDYKGKVALVITNRASDERGQYIHILQAE
ncbi:hypothetical protein V6259_18900 [Marinomonas sp. TI.3.20]|uniref:hypothetical protein n=1 Tax=Marinomonas sp. TI.3.20 TaxID=3121296 RepID=UPI00311DCE15